MASRPSKKLRGLSGIEGVSDRALGRILAHIKQAPDALDEAHSRSTISRQALRAAQEVGLVKHTIALTAGPLVWEVLALQDLLPYLCQHCPHFSQLLGEVYAECGSNWRAVLYCDGVTPGAVLAPENARKSVIWYCTLLEFGARLCHQELWFCLADIETSLSKKVPAQLAGLTRLLVRDMCCGDRALNTAGVILPVGERGRHELVFIHYHATLADEEALSAMNGLKGSASVMPCPLRCWCVGKEKPFDADRGIQPITARAARIVDITCTRKGDIKLKDDAAVWADCDYLEGLLGHADFKELESCTGLNYHPDGILFDRELRRSFKPSSAHRYDPLHILFSNGLLAAEIMYFMNDVKAQTGKYFTEFREWAEGLGWKQVGTGKPWKACSAAREKSSGASLKAGASELLALYPVLRQWALQEFLGVPGLRPSLRSFLLLLDVCDLVLEGATQRLQEQDVEPLARRLDTTVFEYLEAFVAAHGRVEMKHKHHELTHLGDQLRKDKMLLWCFTAERKHIVAKNAMGNSKSLRAFALGTVSRMLLAQIGVLEDNPSWVSRLRPPEIPCDELGLGCVMGNGMRWKGCNAQCGPLFIGRGNANLVWVDACITLDGSFGIVGHPCVHILHDTYAATWAVSGDIVRKWLVHTDVIRMAKHWRFTSDPYLVVLL